MLRDPWETSLFQIPDRPARPRRPAGEDFSMARGRLWAPSPCFCSFPQKWVIGSPRAFCSFPSKGPGCKSGSSCCPVSSKRDSDCPAGLPRVFFLSPKGGPSDLPVFDGRLPLGSAGSVPEVHGVSRARRAAARLIALPAATGMTAAN